MFLKLKKNFFLTNSLLYNSLGQILNKRRIIFVFLENYVRNIL